MCLYTWLEPGSRFRIHVSPTPGHYTHSPWSSVYSRFLKAFPSNIFCDFICTWLHKTSGAAKMLSLIAYRFWRPKIISNFSHLLHRTDHIISLTLFLISPERIFLIDGKFINWYFEEISSDTLFWGNLLLPVQARCTCAFPDYTHWQ